MRKMLSTGSGLVLLTCILSIGCILPGKHNESNDTVSTYDFNAPDEIQVLPGELLEISGLTDISETRVACVQDEKGVIFTYDLISKKVEQQVEFAGDSDYEGLTRVNDVLYSLSSEGTLYETKSAFEDPETETYELNLPSPDNEGLCYDEKDKRLLIAPKSKLGKGPEFKDVRAIFVFDLKKKKMAKEPLFYYHVSAIFDYAKENNIDVTPMIRKNGTASKHHNFRPSSLSIHPKTDDIYMISAEDRCLVVFDKEGTVKGFSVLDEKIFSKPEGITFFPDGTLVITNEGVESSPTLLIFRPRK